jgi:hypothetical protein
MNRSVPRRRSNRVPIIAVAAVFALVGAGLFAMTSVSNATERDRARCGPRVEGQENPSGDEVEATRQNGRIVRNHWGDGQERPDECKSAEEQESDARAGEDENKDDQQADQNDNDGRDEDGDGQDQDKDQNQDQNQDQNADDNNKDQNNEDEDAKDEDKDEVEKIDEGDIIAQNCDDDSDLEPHDGFQNGNRCVDTEMGEVGNEDRNPSLLITDFPEQVQKDEPFQIRVSTRNLIRDRFLAAGQGGYYVEMSKLNEQGLVRGHFHTACRILNNDDEAPDPQPAPAFFVATEDGGGSGQPDEIVIEVPGLPDEGTFQCASWAGDGSHRLPMMQRANQTPAFDAVRIRVE